MFFTQEGFALTWDYRQLFIDGLVCTVSLSALTVIFGFILALVLAGSVEQRHNDRHAVGLAADGAEHALDVLKMLVRPHAVAAAEHRVFAAVIADVAEDINVLPPHGIKQLDFALAVGKADLLRMSAFRFLRR